MPFKEVTVEQHTKVRVKFLSSAHVRRCPCYIYCTVGTDNKALPLLETLLFTISPSGGRLSADLSHAAHHFNDPSQLVAAVTCPETEEGTSGGGGGGTASGDIMSIPHFGRIDIVEFESVADTTALTTHFTLSRECQTLRQLLETNDPTFVSRVLPAFAAVLPNLTLISMYQDHQVNGQRAPLGRQLVQTVQCAVCVFGSTHSMTYPASSVVSAPGSGVGGGRGGGKAKEEQLHQAVQSLQKDIDMWKLRADLLEDDDREQQP